MGGHTNLPMSPPSSGHGGGIQPKGGHGGLLTKEIYMREEDDPLES